MKTFILIVASALLIAGVSAMNGYEDLIHERFRRGVPCRCDSDGPSPHGNTLSGTTFYFLGCHKKGWYKCASRNPSAIATCCKEKKKDE
ncbi:toxin AnmTx Cj 1c-1-like isoform X3 [Tubulanus polymorphus]|uniref:toxin AnmTx Cj 1c-1-like isoform X3 n=1 Tax=Tubulanus polymorphus TaxID=672921 RepID=UPI003DA608B4